LQIWTGELGVTKDVKPWSALIKVKFHEISSAMHFSAQVCVCVCVCVRVNIHNHTITCTSMHFLHDHMCT